MKAKLALVGIGALMTVCATYLIWPEWFGFCTPRSTPHGAVCSSPYGYPYGVIMLRFATSLLLSSILASFTTRRTYKRWIWFTFWSGLAVIILMLLAAAAQIDIGFLTVALFDLEKVAQGLAVLYTGISILLLSISEFLVRRKR